MYCITKILKRGIPFYKTEGFPNLSPCYVTKWEFSLKLICFIYFLLAPLLVLIQLFSFDLFLEIISLSLREHNPIIIPQKIFSLKLCASFPLSSIFHLLLGLPLHWLFVMVIRIM